MTINSKQSTSLKEIEQYLKEYFDGKYEVTKFRYTYPHIAVKQSWVLGVVVQYNEKTQEINVNYKTSSFWFQLVLGGVLFLVNSYFDLKKLEKEVYKILETKYST